MVGSGRVGSGRVGPVHLGNGFSGWKHVFFVIWTIFQICFVFEIFNCFVFPYTGTGALSLSRRESSLCELASLRSASLAITQHNYFKIYNGWRIVRNICIWGARMDLSIKRLINTSIAYYIKIIVKTILLLPKMHWIKYINGPISIIWSEVKFI